MRKQRRCIYCDKELLDTEKNVTWRMYAKGYSHIKCFYEQNDKKSQVKKINYEYESEDNISLNPNSSEWRLNSTPLNYDFLQEMSEHECWERINHFVFHILCHEDKIYKGRINTDISRFYKNYDACYKNILDTFKYAAYEVDFHKYNPSQGVEYLLKKYFVSAMEHVAKLNSIVTKAHERELEEKNEEEKRKKQNIHALEDFALIKNLHITDDPYASKQLEEFKKNNLKNKFFSNYEIDDTILEEYQESEDLVEEMNFSLQNNPDFLEEIYLKDKDNINMKEKEKENDYYNYNDNVIDLEYEEDNLIDELNKSKEGESDNYAR